MSSIVAEIERTELALEKKAYKATNAIFNSNFSRSANLRVEQLMRKYPVGAAISGRGKFIVRTEQDPQKVLAWAVAQRVKSERIQQGLRQEDLAERAGIKRPNIARLEKGFHMPSIPTLQKVALALNLDMGSLMKLPTISPEEMHEYSDMAESGLSEWGKQLGKEDRG